MKTNSCKLQWVVPVLGLFFTALPALAHHSVGAEFYPDKSVTVHGVITKVEWINPHVYLYMDVKGENGEVTQWAFESLPTGFLHKVGITKTLLQGNPGDVVTIDASPAKDGTKNMGWIQKITYPDGHFYVLKGQ